MGVGFAVDCRWAYPVRSPRQSRRQRHAHSQEIVSSQQSASKPYSCSSAICTINRGLSSVEEADEANRDFSSAPKLFKISGSQKTEDPLSYTHDHESLQFSYLLENLHRIEGILVHSDVENLERDILIQIRRLGALEVFTSYLPGVTVKLDSHNRSTLHPYYFQDIHVDLLADEKRTDHNVIVYSRKKHERNLRRKRALADTSEVSFQPLFLNGDKKVENSTASGFDYPVSPDRFASSSHTDTSQRHFVSGNESKLAMGVRDAADLERIRMNIEEKMGRPVGFMKWAEAAGIDPKSLRRRIHFGWNCRDNLLRSTHSLILYLAKSYKGKTISFDDLIQAGKVGVLRGAERFDPSRGCSFSSYVRYWIKKYMSSSIEQPRAIRIPARMENIIKLIQSARKSHADSEGGHLTESEVAELTGISLANIRLANKCSRRVGSLENKIRGSDLKFMDSIPDPSIESPIKVVLNQDLRSTLHKLLAELQPRERQVICLRYGLHDGRCRSLSETGNLANVSKEWIRRIERAAMFKLRNERTRQALKDDYIHLLHI